jgi:signal transduction histidine kinase
VGRNAFDWGVRLGIRAQLVLAIGALLVLAFVPLLYAVASLTRASFAQLADHHARTLGRAVAGHVSEALAARPEAELDELLETQVGGEVGALGVYDAGGKRVRQVGEAATALPTEVRATHEELIEVTTARGPARVMVVPGKGGAVAALVHVDTGAQRVLPLLRLMAFYTGLLAVALLVFLYFVLTRIVVTPVEGLSRAARRVAEGARELGVPDRGGRELVELGASLASMTATLRGEEQKLRAKVDELERATSELRRAQDTVVRSERLASVGRLAAGLAHEIGNPISAILSFEELLLDSRLDEEQREFVVRMKRETERVSRVLRDLLDFARAEAKGDDATAIASVAEAVENVASLVRPQKSWDEVTLSLTVEDDLPAVPMHPERLEQVLLNLLMNASDAVPKPGGQVSMIAERAGEGVRIVVEDNGPGIPEAVRSRLFEPFVTTKEVGKGTGLGLAVCRGLIEAASGTIEAERGKAGARFVIQLPAATEDRV